MTRSSLQLGLYSQSLPGAAGLDAAAILHRVRSLELDGCLFPSPLSLSRTLDPAELDDLRACADGLGLYIDLGLGQIDPYSFAARPDIVQIGDGEAVVGLERAVAAAQRVGCHQLLFTIGTLADRASRSVPWPEHLQATTRFLLSVAPILRNHSCRLNLKTHEEISTFEVVRMVEAVGPDVLGVAFDPVNVLVRLEHPIAAARRIAEYVQQVHLDDAALAFVPAGLERLLRPCGMGQLAWPALMDVLQLKPDLRLTIELHRAQFQMPLFDSEWCASQADITPAELASVVQLAATSAPIEGGAAFATDPSSRLAPTLTYLKEFLER